MRINIVVETPLAYSSVAEHTAASKFFLALASLGHAPPQVGLSTSCDYEWIAIAQTRAENFVLPSYGSDDVHFEVLGGVGADANIHNDVVEPLIRR